MAPSIPVAEQTTNRVDVMSQKAIVARANHRDIGLTSPSEGTRLFTSSL